MQKQMLENYIFTRGSIFWECSHCLRRTICFRERTPKQLQYACHLTELQDTFLFRRMCRARLCAMPVQHVQASDQAQEDIPSNK